MKTIPAYDTAGSVKIVKELNEKKLCSYCQQRGSKNL